MHYIIYVEVYFLT